jgi:hypothetical protein
LKEQHDFKTRVATRHYKAWKGADADMYLAWKFDYRYRVSPHGLPISVQGTDWEKSMMEFSRAKKVDARGMKYLKRAIVNAVGFDKLLHEERIELFDKWNQLNPCMESQFSVWMKQIKAAKRYEDMPNGVDEPYVFYGLYQAYLKACLGQPVGVVCHVDATASCTQFIAAGYGDITGMINSNVMLPLDGVAKRHDPYTKMKSTLDVLMGELAPSRKAIKTALMSACYGGLKDLIKVFGDNEHVFWQALQQDFPSAYMFVTRVRQMWNQKVDMERSFTLPDGAVVRVRPTCVEYSFADVDSVGKVVMSEAKYGYDSNFVAFLSAIVHALDAYAVRCVIRAHKAHGTDIVTIHDSFGSHVNDVWITEEAYKECMKELVRDNVLGNILDEMFGAGSALKAGVAQHSNSLKDQICELINKSEYAVT